MSCCAALWTPIFILSRCMMWRLICFLLILLCRLHINDKLIDSAAIPSVITIG